MLDFTPVLSHVMGGFGMAHWETGMSWMKNWEESEGTEVNIQQSVRRKGGKKGPGSVYIICSLNPKHKQRQGK